MPKFAMRRVVFRKPVPFMPHVREPKYLLVYVIETLECGHTLRVFPQSDPLIARARHCQSCDEDEVTPIDVPKKPPESVRLPIVERKRA